MEHFNFFSRKQHEGEQFDVWYTDLKKLIKGCNFGDAESKILRTQIVLGVYDKGTQARSLKDDVIWAKVISYCQAVDCAESNRRILTTVSEVDRMVHEVWFKTKWTSINQNRWNSPNAKNSNQKHWKGNESKEHRASRNDKSGIVGKLINYNRCGLEHIYIKSVQRMLNVVENVMLIIILYEYVKKKRQFEENDKMKKSARDQNRKYRRWKCFFSWVCSYKIWSIENEKVFQVNGKNVNFKLDSWAEIRGNTKILEMIKSIISEVIIGTFWCKETVYLNCPLCCVSVFHLLSHLSFFL